MGVPDVDPAELVDIQRGRVGVLCRYHHTHFLQRGWTCRLYTDRLPEWIPPRWIDPGQHPQLNTRIRRLWAQRQQRRPRRRTADAA